MMTYLLYELKQFVLPKFGYRSQLEMLLFTSNSQFCLLVHIKRI